MRVYGFAGLVGLLAITSCSNASQDNADDSIDESSGDLTRGGECVHDTFFVESGTVADIKNAFNPSLIHNYGGPAYPHIEIPGIFDMVIAPGEEYGEALYTILGFDFRKEEVERGSQATPRRLATISVNAQRDPRLKLKAKQYAAAKGLFEAMTGVEETTENHVVPASQVYDRSWEKKTRATANGHLVCTATVYTGSGETRPDYTCTFYGVEGNMVQSYNTTGTNGKCLAK